MTVTALVPQDGLLSLGGTDFVCQVVAGVITSVRGEVRTETMCDVVTTYARAEYFLEIDFLQDWTATTGISWYLYTNNDATVAYVWEPTADGAPKMAGSVRIREGSFGGVAGQHARDRVRLACTARPTLTAGAS